MVKRREEPKSEVELIERLRARSGGQRHPGVALGIGDDCAIYRAAKGRDLVFTTDMTIEDVHFRRATHKAADVGWKALARGLSDIAAMGATPRFCLLSLALAPWTEQPWIDGFFDAVIELGTETGTPLAGGDLARSGVLTCDIVVCGEVARGRGLRRDGARVGDRVFVSGALGGSALGLETQRGAAWKRHLRPEPRLALGKRLIQVGASAAMDLSDGLSLDLRRLCLASGVAAEIVPPPRFQGASLAQALHGGEDYELLFTAPATARVPKRYQGLPLTCIGTITEGEAGEVRLLGEKLAPLGYDHLR
jgi:thiamine-monophosphate kinase